MKLAIIVIIMLAVVLLLFWYSSNGSGAAKNSEPGKALPQIIQNQSQPIIQANSQNQTIIAPNESIKPKPIQSASFRNFTIANWNLQIFGDSKASNSTLLGIYSSIIKEYDIVFAQEIRDKDGSSFASLCKLLPDYNCNVSSKAGRTASKEQIGIIYRKGIVLSSLKDFNPDAKDRWERPPIMAVFNIGNYSLSVYNMHDDPDTVPAELSSLESIVEDKGKVMLLGDFNADCSYYPIANRTQFKNWTWVIQNGEDTTVHNSVCAYDRILLNKNATSDYLEHGIRTDGITADVSDHYLVWARMIANAS